MEMKKISGLWPVAAAMLLTFSGVPAHAEEALNSKWASLGGRIYFDNISDPDSMSCAECHAASVGWTGPNPGINKNGAVYPGAAPQAFGNRKPPSSGYATLAPLFQYDGGDAFSGGNFWDGRATGWRLGNPAADQGQGPFLNPAEHNLKVPADVVEQVCTGSYAREFEELFADEYEGLDACDPANIDLAYDFVGLAIASYEDSFSVNAFSSKYDEGAELTELEAQGHQLFFGKAGCSGCHSGEAFTDFSFHNVGAPINPLNPVYDANPNWIDLGLGDFLRTLADGDSWRDQPYVTNVAILTAAQLSEFAEQNDGKQKVPTLRNVDRRPGAGFVKAYMHNGALKSLEEVVHFFNDRESFYALYGFDGPEVSENLSVAVGNLGLTQGEEEALVAFLKTLSDGYAPEKGKK